MSHPTSPSHSSDDCARFEATLGSWLERDTDDTDAAWMTHHRMTCQTCAALVADIEGLVADAGALPPLTPSRDLWAGIESRLEAQVIPIGRGTRSALASAAPASAPVTPRTFRTRTLAIAATVLVAVSSGVTWQLTRPTRPLVDSRDVATLPTRDVITDTAQTGQTLVAPPGAERLTPRTGAATANASGTRLVSDDDLPEVDATYEREIRGLRQIVDERFAELDTSTVSALRRNLDIIDRAIADSKAALARDPRSALLSSQLDRALEAKLQLMRRVALL